MREILFRGKRVDNGEWVEGLPFGSIYGGFSNGAICAIRQTVEKYGDIHDVVIETVGEYTGMTDKNGKKIFEGDIIRYLHEYVAVIIFENGMLLAKCNGFVFMFTPDECPDIEVIGTVYDNSELLEGWQ